MANEGQQLLIDVEARITQFEKSMARAAKVANENYTAIEARGKRSAKTLDDRFANVGKNAKRNTANLNDAFSTSKAADGARLTHMQFQILSGAARDAFASIASGQSVMTVLAQQGSNVQAAIGEDGVLGLLGGIGNGLKGLITPATAGAAALLAIGTGAAYAYSRWTDEQLALELSLTGIGRASGLTVDQIRAMGDEIANTARISTGSARDITAAIAGTGKITGDNVSAVAGLAPGYAKLFGGSMSDAGKALAGIFSDPAKGAATLDERIGMLDDRTRRYIRSLVEQGDRQGAIKALVTAVQPELQRAADLTSAWAKAWEAVKSAADGAANSVGKAVERAVKGPDLKEQLAQLKAKRNGSEGDYVDELKRQGLDEKTIKSIVPTYQGSNTKALDAEIAKVEALIKADEELTKARAEEARAKATSKAAGDIVDSLSEEGEAVKSLANRYKALGDALADPAVVEHLDDADKAKASYDALGKRVETLKDDYKAGGQAAAQALRAANFSAATAGLDSYRKGLAAINHEYDEQIRLARQSGDAATTAARVATLEAARGSAVKAYNVETQERAKQSVAVPSDYASSVIGAESSGNDAAKNPRSSATGAGQFINSTWLTLFKRVYSDMAAGLSDDSILALRQNREYSARLIEEYARENAVALQQAGLEATSANLHLAHFLGAGGAVKMLKADPTANAASILPGAAASNPEVFKRGSASVQDVLDYAGRRAQRGGTAGKAQTERVTALKAEAEAYDKAAAEAEKLKSVQEQLDADREKGGELGQRFATAQDLIKASSEGLTPALKAQRDEILSLADARAKAAQTGLSARFEADQNSARAALGRSSSEQQVYATVKSAGYDPASEIGQQAAAVVRLNQALGETKNTATGALSGFLTDLAHGTNAAQALQNALMRVVDTLINKLSDQLISSLFSTGTSSGASAGGLFAGIGKLFGFAEGGHVTGAGSGTSDSIPALLSNGEYVITAAQTAKHRRLLDAINSGNVSRFASGGLVGAAPMPSLPAGAGPGGAVNQNITLAPTINLTAAGGTPEQNADLSARMNKQIETSLRKLVSSELQTQMRPGGMLR